MGFLGDFVTFNVSFGYWRKASSTVEVTFCWSNMMLDEKNQIEHHQIVPNVACFKLQNKPNKRPRIDTFRSATMSKVKSRNLHLLTNQSQMWTKATRVPQTAQDQFVTEPVCRTLERTVIWIHVVFSVCVIIFCNI